MQRRVRSARSSAFAKHSGTQRQIGNKKKRGRPRPSPLSVNLYENQVQVITPPVISQVCADCECVAVALHEGGGPATFVATIVTFCDGVNPWRGAAIVAVPPKYAPPLSAAYCSS